VSTIAEARAPGTWTPEATVAWLERVAVMLALLGVSATTFVLIDHAQARLLAHSRILHLESAWDAAIPFVPEFVFVYVAYYVWVLLPALVLNHRVQFYRAVTAFGFAQAVAITVFVIVPSSMVRPEITGGGPARDLLRLLYAIDPGFNVLPSLHVAHSALVAMYFRSVRPALFPLVAIGSLLISLSTLLIKQHWLWDVPAGLGLALVSYYVATPLHARICGQPRSGSCTADHAWGNRATGAGS
jgi:membrane-associated phospholipid phosphatase